MKAYGYTRMFENDVPGALSMDRQKQFIRDYARDQNIELVEFFEDGFANDETFPPGLKSMVSHVGPVRAVIVKDLDRLGLRPEERSLVLADLEAQDISVICAATDEDISEETSD